MGGGLALAAMTRTRQGGGEDPHDVDLNDFGVEYIDIEHMSDDDSDAPRQQAQGDDESPDDESDSEFQVARDHLRAILGGGIPGGLQRLLALYGLQLVGDDGDSESETEGVVPNELWEPVGPVRAGTELSKSGEFGPMSYTNRSIAAQITARKTNRRTWQKSHFNDLIPNSAGVVVARYPAPCYSGQFSEDASMYYTCSRDMRIHIYDMTKAPRRSVLEVEDSMEERSGWTGRRTLEQATTLHPLQTIEALQGQWTITDATLSPDSRWMIYSSITPHVGLARVNAEGGSQDHTLLDFSAGDPDRFGIWSLRFSGDSREIIAGAHYGSIIVFDLETQRRLLNIQGHEDDVNGVAFADAGSSNVFVSGSDDSLLKVWDRRSLRQGRPAGLLPGHTEGITYISPKGDGRYCISNSKDQSVRLWDLRMLRSGTDVERWSHLDYGLRNWDYRYMSYRRPRNLAHPEDCSVMVYRGHSVLRTLIRCHFSPRATTGQQYIYSGSADGRVHVRVC